MTPKRSELPSGAMVVSERMPELSSVAFGLYFPTGSRHETVENNGISHFIEHLVFKGTAKRDADEINREIDLLGGASNAYTTKESICFHARVLAEHLPRVVDFFGDMATGALPDGIESEVEREREVILQEISAVEDSPEDLVGDLVDRASFGEHALGLPIVGSARAVGSLALPEIRSHFRRHLVASDVVVAACGQVDHDQLCALAVEHLDGLPTQAGPALSPAPVPAGATRCATRDFEQVQLCLSARGITRSDSRRTAADLLNAIVGEGFSSRLFREVRDRRGLAYTIYSSFASYLDTGSFNVYFGVSPERMREALDVVGRVLADVRGGAIDSDELERARVHLRGSMILAHESAGARLGHLAEKTLLGEDELELAHDLRALERASLAQVNELAAELLAGPLAVAAVGPVDEAALPSPGWELPG